MRRPEFKAFQDFLIGIKGIADNIDIADARWLAFIDIDLQLDPITRQWHHFTVDAGAVTTLGYVLALQLRGNTLERGTAKYFTLRQTGLLQPFAQLFFVDRLVTI